ncbi:MAG: FAD-dependent oxidoreductase [Candidatus Omnitrophica bacterium]|nr:FAD-dependent oxidoreductase [Candidatus Omnitrophota bacterium]
MGIFDLIIIGAGPAGITAAVYAARKKMKFLVISKDIGGQTAWSGDIENYTGYQFITGPELVSKFEEHMKKYNIPLRENETAVEVSKKDVTIYVKTDKGEYETKTVIVASGKRSRELGVPGEREYKNKGLTYCATCDGPLFSNKDVAVIGGGNSALDATIQLMSIANKVYLVNIAPDITGDPVMKEKIERDNKVIIMNSSQVITVQGQKMVTGIRVKKNGQEKILSVQGIFVEVGLIPNSDFVKGVDKNERGEIKVNSYNRTNVPGIFAAGDATDVPEKQIIIAAGEGAKATLEVFKYLSRLK